VPWYVEEGPGELADLADDGEVGEDVGGTRRDDV